MIPLFIFVLLGSGLGLLYFASRSSASIPPPEGFPAMPRLTGTFLPDDEITTIVGVATQYDVDPRFLAAIRKAENGGPGREFGVVSVPAPTYRDQAMVAAQSIANNIARYQAEMGYSAEVNGRLTDDFVRYMAARWAPIGAANDPGNLNQYWVSNVSNFYRSIDYA